MLIQPGFATKCNFIMKLQTAQQPKQGREEAHPVTAEAAAGNPRYLRIVGLIAKCSIAVHVELFCNLLFKVLI